MITIKYEKENDCARAYDGDKAIGICQYEVLPGKWIIDHTSTDPEYGGQGIARKLVECVADNAQHEQVELGATCWYAKKVLGV